MLNACYPFVFIALSKMTENDGVPQVGAYVTLGEIEAGFVNMTEAMAQQHNIGGYLAPRTSCYDRIRITVTVMKAHQNNPAVTAWFDYLRSPSAQQILDRYELYAHD